MGIEEEHSEDEAQALIPKGNVANNRAWLATEACTSDDESAVPLDVRLYYRPHRRLAAALGTLATLGVVALACVALAQQGGRKKVSGVTSEEAIELAEDDDPCDKYPYLKYEVPNSVIYNNLANKGPDHGHGEGIVFKTIDLGEGAGKELDREVYMTINATSHHYKPFSPRMNGLQGKYGSINLNSGSSVELELNWYDRETMRQLTMPELALTFFDLDTGSGGSSTEYVRIGGFKSHHLTKATEVHVTKQNDGTTEFKATRVGTGKDNPKDPNFLTEQQENRAVTLLYGPTKTLKFRIGATSGSGPRFFTFVCRPSLLCATTVQENYRPPLPDLTFTPPMEDGISVHRGEEFVSFSVKKGDKVKKGQVIATTKKGNSQNQYFAKVDGEVTQIQDKLKPGEKLDERLSEKLIAVITRPKLEPLQTSGDEVPGGPGKEAKLPAETTFKKFLVDIGDVVHKDDPIAVVETNSGGRRLSEGEIKVKATNWGVVKSRQDMKAGMLLKEIPDANLITLGPLPALGPLDKDTVATAPVPEGDYTFDEYRVKKGDIVKPGDTVAMMTGPNGHSHAVRAKHGGVISGLQDIKSGTPIDRISDRNLATTGKFPALPVEPGMAPIGVAGAGTPAPLDELSRNGPTARPIGETPPEQQGPIDPDGLKFVKYYIKPGDVVETGDKIAQVEDKSGEKHDVLAPRPGVVKHIQDGLKEGMTLEKVLHDNNLATIDKLPKLDVGDGEEPAFAPKTENWQLKEWLVKEGDTVAKGDPIALLEKPTGDTKKVLAGKAGVVTQIRSHLKPGDEIEESTTDSDLAVIGKNAGPDIGFREMGVDVPDLGCTFVGWRIKEGDEVKAGEPIADVKCPTRRLSEAERRLQQLREFSIPSPGSGKINWMADIKPGQTVREAAASPTIAKIDMGWPWWLWLLPLLLLLCCCLGLLFLFLNNKKKTQPTPQKKQKEAWQPQQQPQTYQAMNPAPAPTPEPLHTAKPWPYGPQPEVKPVEEPKPHGLRLDFEDTYGKTKTVYARYRPLGIRHNWTAPIVAHDFTCNAYARQELGVHQDWKLTRIGDDELHDSKDFEYVNGKLERHLKEYPVWPLPLELRKNPEDAEVHTYKFVERPLGLEFTNVAPIKVDKVYNNSPAARHGVEVGWYLTKIGDFDVHENHNFREVLKYFKEGVQGLDENELAGRPESARP